MHWSKIAERHSADVVILDLRGNVTFCESPGRLFVAIDQLVQHGHRKILLNLSDVPYIDSQALGDIVRGSTATRDASGVLKLCCISERIRRLLMVTRLATVIEAFDTEQEALNSFR